MCIIHPVIWTYMAYHQDLHHIPRQHFIFAMAAKNLIGFITSPCQLTHVIHVLQHRWSLYDIVRCQSKSKECRSIVRDESSVYFNVTAKHVWHLVATVYKPTVPCMITIELSDIWLISEAIYHLIFTQDLLNWSLKSPPQHRDDFVMPTFLYRFKNSQKC